MNLNVVHGHAIVNGSEAMVVELDAGLAIQAAELGLRHKLPRADSVIYATAKRARAKVWTLGADFEGLPDVRYWPGGG
ncbi:MAG: PIN domain-containing protein [Xanthomonadaceae bacterium]|nr:PIN domain-containing protein [Xanthomonadaceae bacterium]